MVLDLEIDKVKTVMLTVFWLEYKNVVILDKLNFFIFERSYAKVAQVFW